MNTFKFPALILFSGIFLVLLDSASAHPQLIELWSIEKRFIMPESAAYDPIGQQVFVSNVNEYAKDGNGFISSVSADGAKVEEKWLAGLNSPTGLVVRDGLLYAVDFDQLLVIDIATRAVLVRAPAPHENPMLNDVAVSADGQVFVTGSASTSIYVLQDEHLAVWKQDKTQLRHANGLLFAGDRLVFGGTKWWIFELESKQVVKDFRAPEPPVAEVDGITHDGGDGYFITMIGDHRIWHVDASNESRAVSELPIKGIDIDYRDGKLYVPQVGGGLSVFEVTMHDGDQ